MAEQVLHFSPRTIIIAKPKRDDSAAVLPWMSLSDASQLSAMFEFEPGRDGWQAIIMKSEAKRVKPKNNRMRSPNTEKDCKGLARPERPRRDRDVSF